MFGAFYDANVLYPAHLRSLLMYLATTGLFRAKWSAAVQEEWIFNLLENRPDLTRDKLERTRHLMEKHAPDALVTNYEDLIPSLRLPDPDDRHVLAAAIRSRADVIVTMNLKDFPAESIAPYGLEAQHPDEFVEHLLDLDPSIVLTAAQRHWQSYKNPPQTAAEYLRALEQQGLTKTASILREHMLDVLLHLPVS